MLKAYKYRIYPTSEQKSQIDKTIPGDLKRWMEEQAKLLGKESTAPDKETPDWLETDIKRGMKAMHDLLSPQIESLKSSLSASERFRMEDTWDKINKIEEQCKEIERLKRALIKSDGYRAFTSHLNSEQEDKRSVATEGENSNDAGNIK